MSPTIEPFGVESQPPDSPFFQSPEGGLILIRTIQQNSSCIYARKMMLQAINSSKKQVVLFPPFCKKWDCPICGPKNAHKARLRALAGYEAFVSQGHKMSFLTLTPHEKLSSAASIPVMAKAWNKLNVRIKRASQHHNYFLIPEFHKSGKLHFHALVDADLKKRWWKDNGRACGMGYQNDLQEVNEIGGVGGYLTKYLTKMLESEATVPKGFRRIRTSQSWPSLPEMGKPDGWEFKPAPKDYPLDHVTDYYQRLGYTVVIADEASSWAWIGMWT